MNFRHIIALILAFNTSAILAADDYIDLQTTYIKGNKEMPQILYVVPWQDLKKSKSEEQYLILHSLFDDVFDPVTTDKVITGHTVIK